MVRLLVTGFDGGVHEIEARHDLTVMEAIRDAGLDDMQALCGGCMACGTCHIYVDEAHYPRLPGPGMAERRMLAGSNYQRPTSRLACQIEVEEVGAALALTLAPAE